MFHLVLLLLTAVNGVPSDPYLCCGYNKADSVIDIFNDTCYDGEHMRQKCQHYIFYEYTDHFMNDHELIYSKIRSHGNSYCLGYDSSYREVTAFCGAYHWYDSNALKIFSDVVTIFFIILVSLTFFIYCLIPELRNNRIDAKSTMHFLAALALSNIILLICANHGYKARHNKVLLYFYASLLHYTFSLSITWWAILCFELWRQKAYSGKLTELEEERTYKAYYLLGYAMPVIFMLTKVTLMDVDMFFFQAILHHTGSGKLLSDVPLLICSVFVIWRCKIEKQILKETGKETKWNPFFFVAKVSFLMLPALIAARESVDRRHLSVFSDLLTGLHGIAIFLGLIPLRHKALKTISSRRLFNIRWPQKWTNLPEEEDDDEQDQHEEDNAERPFAI